MKAYKDLIEPVEKITEKNNHIIVVSNNKKYVIKKNKNKMIYDYLSSRGFTYYLEPIKRTQDYNLFEYINEVETPREQKALDTIHIMAYLHKKTTYYKEINLDKIKKIYEDVLNNIMYLYEYYHTLQDSLEQEEFFSPSTYMLLREISFLYASLDNAKENIDVWYENIKKETELRMALIHNHLDTTHILESGNKYLISWDYSKKDIPIYDFYHFFNMEYEITDFNLLYQEYKSIYPITKIEEDLLFSLLLLPDKVTLTLDEYDNCTKIRKMYLKLRKARNLVLNERTKKQKQEQPKL